MKAGLLKVVAEEMQIGTVIIDEHGVILYANPFFEKTIAEVDAVEGRIFSDVVADPVLLNTVHDLLSSGDNQARESTVYGKENQVLEVKLVPFSQEGIKGLIGFFRDITEEKRVEEIKRDFVANVSHELRTPLASIKGYSETLLDRGMEDKSVLKNFLTIIDRHANRMTALIEDLLTLSMLESHQIPLNFEALDIMNMLNNIIQGFEKQANDKGIALLVDMMEADKSVQEIMGDKVRLEQVIVNLIDNAIKYTNKGTVKVSITMTDNMLRIDVQDTGIGIPDKDIPRIFERFYRVDKGRSRELGGTGLGLAIVKHIIQGHKGKIWVNSKVGAGTTFSILLPVSQNVAT